MIIVTHEIGFAREVADTLVFMDQGKIVERDTPARLIDRPQSVRAQAFFKSMLK